METKNLLKDVRTNALNQVNLKKEAYLKFNEVLRLWKKETEKKEIDFWAEFGECPSFVWSTWGGMTDISMEQVVRFELDEEGDLKKVFVRNAANNDVEDIVASEFIANDYNDLNWYSTLILEYLNK